jgi:hypothetical protein
MPGFIVIISILLAIAVYVLQLRRSNLPGVQYFLAIAVSPLLALIIGTAVLQVAENELLAILAAVVGGPLALAFFSARLAGSSKKKDAPPLLALAIYGSTIFLCGLLLLAGISWA